MPTDDADLETAYSAQDYDDVATDDDVRVDQTATNQFMIHQFKNWVGSSNTARLHWQGQTTLAPSASTVYLEIFNRNTDSWETIDSDNTSPTGTDFDLDATIPDLTDYLDEHSVIACRVYQEAV